MSSIKQLIVNAIIKVSGENPSLNREGEPSADQARDDFIKALLAELFPEDPTVPVPSPKKTKAKKTKDVPVEVVVPAAEPTPSPEPSPEKKKRAPMSEETKAAMKVKRDATLAAKKATLAAKNTVAAESPAPEAVAAVAAPVEAEPVKEKKPKKAKVVEDVNLPKLDPTWKKYLKNADKEHAKELEPELLKVLNAMTKEEFNAKKAEEHVTTFINSRNLAASSGAGSASAASASVDDEKVEAELTEIEFNGNTYFVNPETKRVYEGEGEFDEETGWTNYKPVGYVGMAAFAEMSLDE